MASQAPQPQITAQPLNSTSAKEGAQKDSHPQHLRRHSHHLRKRRRDPHVLHVSFRHGQLRDACSLTGRHPSAI
jgi:hypothetical protein